MVAGTLLRIFLIGSEKVRSIDFLELWLLPQLRDGFLWNSILHISLGSVFHSLPHFSSTFSKLPSPNTPQTSTPHISVYCNSFQQTKFLVGLPLIIRMGGDDTNVPPYHLRRMVKKCLMPLTDSRLDSLTSLVPILRIHKYQRYQDKATGSTELWTMVSCKISLTKIFPRICRRCPASLLLLP
jgi:hypothetical protein